MLPPPPEVARITAEAMFHVVEGEDEDVEAARESFALQHSELAGLYAEVHPRPSSEPRYRGCHSCRAGQYHEHPASAEMYGSWVALMHPWLLTFIHCVSFNLGHSTVPLAARGLLLVLTIYGPVTSCEFAMCMPGVECAVVAGAFLGAHCE